MTDYGINYTIERRLSENSTVNVFEMYFAH